ncbi:uncharacterized protein conserved in bacteria [Serpentinimonas raichei]|jgi:tripartite-type tricarboxylate transporter receptor subunit TctC|uniref:Uncharacterized protein conserved in bacteria n=1 Tax=Serpentinimonas raichei TaxID=1458425 RepID=A0A060NNH7_9BURK|nr:tripartite tricarboxylate transporter substrate-binding protein [Serpentinimonas raichei]BAO81088.1 uncharacterized protein conserved in bacteria [Serpentinimonas raichei]
MQRRTLMGAAGLASMLTASGRAWARAFPSRSLRLIVPFTPGGSADMVARSVATPLAALLGQSVAVDNRTGAGGAIGTHEVARAAPDGYTLGLSAVSTLATNPAFIPNTPYHPVNDFTPIINLVVIPLVLAVHPSFPARDFDSFLREVRRHPGRYSYATPGTGTLLHLLGELIELESRIFMVHIPYRGTAPALVDVKAGRVPIIFDALPGVMPHIQPGGRLIPLAVASPQRLAQLPQVPTFAEVGLPIANRGGFFGLIGPRGLPGEVVQRIHSDTVRVLADPALRQRLEDAGAPVVGSTPEQFAEQIRFEFDFYTRLVQRTGIRPD